MRLPLTLAQARRSPIRVPRRDIVAPGAGGLTLEVTLVASDRPDAPPLDLTGLGLGLQVLTWDVPENDGGGDYGMAWLERVATLRGLVAGTVVNGPAGRINVVLPSPTRRAPWGRRWWAAQLDHGGDVSTIAAGVLSMQPGVAVAAHEWLQTDSLAAITDDALSPIEV